MANGHGGKRDNSGRRKGSRNSLTQQLLREVVSEKDQLEILKSAIKKAKGGDKDLQKFFLEHFHGKVPQQLDVNNTLRFDKVVSGKDIQEAIQAEEE